MHDEVSEREGIKGTNLSSEGNGLNFDKDVDTLTDLTHLGRYVLKISDMGLSKQLDAGDASFGKYEHEYEQIRFSRGTSSSTSIKDPVGTIGWQAPELMMALRNGVESGTIDKIEGFREEEDKNTDDLDETEIHTDATISTTSTPSTPLMGL